MSVPTQSIIDTRSQQMFPALELAEIERVRRFGAVRSYGAGEALAKVGEVGHGLTIILAGKVDITRHDESGRREPIVAHGHLLLRFVRFVVVDLQERCLRVPALTRRFTAEAIDCPVARRH